MQMVLVCVYCGQQAAIEVEDCDLATVLCVDTSTVCRRCYARLVYELVPASWYVIRDGGDRLLSA
jgi:ribosomal protein L40E